MDNVIILEEVRLRKSIKEAEDTLKQARTLISLGEEVPEGVIPKLEQIIAKLEQKLINIFENSNG
jgi:hypothetical protein